MIDIFLKLNYQVLAESNHIRFFIFIDNRSLFLNHQQAA